MMVQFWLNTLTPIGNSPQNHLGGLAVTGREKDQKCELWGPLLTFLLRIHLN